MSKICMILLIEKFNKRQNISMVIEVKIVVILEGSTNWEET